MSRHAARGFHSVRALLLSHPGDIVEILSSGRRRDRRAAELRALAKKGGVPWREAEAGELDECAGGRGHQGVVALCRRARPAHDLPWLLAGPARRGDCLLLVLDRVTDPRNLGACLRVADAAGASAVVIPGRGAAEITDVVRKTASGAAESVPLVRVANLSRCLAALAERGVWIFGADASAEGSFYRKDFRSGPLALVLGGEGNGLRRLTRERCDELLALPMLGAVESLNVAVAAGVCLFEVARQRGGAGAQL